MRSLSYHSFRPLRERIESNRVYVVLSVKARLKSAIVNRHCISGAAVWSVRQPGSILRPQFSIQWWLTARPNSTRSSVRYYLPLAQSASDTVPASTLVLVVLYGRPLTPILMTVRCRAFYLDAMAGWKSQRDAPSSRCHRQLHLRLFEAREKHSHRHISCDNNRQRICERDVE